jgi:predicted  nucleic acid-binding Zn-ribbon protein
MATINIDTKIEALATEKATILTTIETIQIKIKDLSGKLDTAVRRKIQIESMEKAITELTK